MMRGLVFWGREGTQVGGFLGGRWDGVRRWLVEEDSKQGKEAKEKGEEKRKKKEGGDPLA